MGNKLNLRMWRGKRIFWKIYKLHEAHLRWMGYEPKPFEPKCYNFSLSTPRISFSPSGFPILPLNFLIFFALQKNFEMCFSKFFRIWTRKTLKNVFRNFYTRAKMKKWGVEKKHGGKLEQIYHDHYKGKCQYQISFLLKSKSKYFK
jgi:hypothetical protein